MLLCQKIDLDLTKEVDAYENALETIKYLQDVVNSIESRVLSGEEIDGLELDQGQKRRTITDFGLEYLSKTFGEDFVYKVVKKPITVTELDKNLSTFELSELVQKGVIQFKETNPKIKIVR
jgi:hypothetical protein